MRWRYDGGWSAPTPLTLPSGATTGASRGINRLGQIVGRLDASDLGAVWDDPATPVRLDGLPDAINSAGTLHRGRARRTARVLDAFGDRCVEHRRRGAANARRYVRW